jgi:hypothetical protein
VKLIRSAAWLLAAAAAGLQMPASLADEPKPALGQPGPQFITSDRCMACHNGMTAADGQEMSIGIDWRASLMANSSRDPYWQASVRRETLDHAGSRAAIEDDCSACHMPITRYEAKAAGHPGEVLSHLPLRMSTDPQATPPQKQAADGVSCSVCHQITPQGLGTQDSFNGNFVVQSPKAPGTRFEFGPFDIDPGLMRVMHSSTGGFQPTRGDQIRSAELCATCHTLITQALGPDGRVIGSLPEQVPYQEWLHSDYRTQRTCQSCHMPAVNQDVPIARVLGIKRPGVSRHEFVAANFFVQRMLERYHDELSVTAPPQELSAAAQRTVDYLQSQSARISVVAARVAGDKLTAEVVVENLGGHKLPTAFPSRRAWLHLVARDQNGTRLFESGALQPDGSIQGNDNDADPARYEPHYREIHRPDEVQIYESILGDAQGGVTTGLLSSVGYLKDNRLLPRGFDKTTAAPEIAVHGDALIDPGFTDRGDRVRYLIDLDLTAHAGPYQIEAELWYQPIGYRWAENLKSYDADEPRRFNGHYSAMAVSSAIQLARAQAIVK